MSLVRSRKHSSPLVRPSRLSAAVALLLPAVTVQAQASTLPDVQVNATQEIPYKAERSASRKYDQLLVDTPQTLTVIKRTLVDQQGATTLTEALRNSPGVGTFFLGENGSTSTGDTVYMRGFDASSAIFVDNVRDLGAISRDLFNLEQVEVLKGPAGSDNGRGSPTGSINLITKQPEMLDATTASATYGSWGQKRATVDWNKILDQDRGIALRLNLMKQDSGVPGRHEVSNARDGIAPSLALGLNGPTRVLLNYLHIRQDNIPDGGVPTIGLPGYTSPDRARPFIGTAPKVDPANYYGNVNDYNKINVDMFTARVEHDFSPTLKLQNTTRYARTDQDYRLSSFLANGITIGTGTRRRTAGLLTPSAEDRSSWLLARNIVTRRDQVNEIMSNQTHLGAQWQTGTLQHALSGGLELTHEKQRALSFTVSGSRPHANLYRPDPRFSEANLAIASNGNNEGKTDTVSLYLMDTLRFDERWSLNAGLREDIYRTRFDSSTPDNRTGLSSTGKLFNWKLAGIFKPTGYSSLYALYATSQQPPGGANFSLSASRGSAANPDYAPQKTRTAEVGTKWDLLDRKLLLTAAAYRTEVRNEVEFDDLANLYFQTGRKVVQGVELGVTGDLTSDISVTAGYSRMNSRVASGKTVTASGENTLAYAPRQSFTSWASWRLPHGIRLGGGARYSAGLVRGTATTAVGTPQRTQAYWVMDAMAAYVVNKNMDLQFNVTNLFNKDYVGSLNKTGYRYLPGAARAVSLTGNFHF
ncbi:catecholate siderophore receptor Fiu [Herbaspirillum sp. NPDC087042]|uniref:catecholate siderophore receptor Fiu n=1 Tax=Herbaspirillum sp. NPDC087042 TaxID=3364004 RepID=UPI0038112FB6